MTSRFLIIEGPDCSGKTTLAQFLATETHSLYWHMSGHPRLHACMPEYHQKSLESIAWNLQNGRSVILDRSWPSEFVYGREFRPNLVDRFPFKEFQERIKVLNGRYIFCMDDSIAERFDKMHVANDHFYEKGEFQGVLVGYRVLMEHMLTRPDTRHYSMLEHGQNMRGVLQWV